MNIEDLTRIMSEKQKTDMLIDLTITNICNTQALFVLVANAFNVEEARISKSEELLQSLSNECRIRVVDDLYELYGKTPPDILE
jgi:hypothetical protein